MSEQVVTGIVPPFKFCTTLMASKDHASMLYRGVGILQFPLLSRNHSHAAGELVSLCSFISPDLTMFSRARAATVSATRLGRTSLRTRS